ncbi:MAG: hypothetical protein J6M16_00570 [Clostridia bacterium]|nr:hypothetical protein [Clostridia bacterium]
MKKLYLVARNHMDPSWLRGFCDHFKTEDGNIIRPYSDVEEQQILEYMDFAELYGVKYHIEQSLVVKKLLERNPDQKERFKELVNKGYLELAGGGETVIDCNLTQGESWVRNHLYSRKYYKDEFGHTPKYAITPDIFGLPAQLPQFFRSIGYDALIIFDRVMQKNKPFWQGLDGTRIVLDDKWLNNPEPGLRTADCTKIQACPACHGEGCDICQGVGIDMSYDMTTLKNRSFRESYYGNMTAEEVITKLINENPDKDTFFLMIVTEEPRVGEFLYKDLKNIGNSYGVEVNYLTFEENHDRWCEGYVDRLRNGNYTEDEVDFRVEGNPAGCGCYTSRIEIKQGNRELEDTLLEAERLCVLAKMNGGFDEKKLPRRAYPKRKLRELWSKMAFIQFHDCLPGSICDGSVEEVYRYIREVRQGAQQIYRDASLELLRSIGVKIPEGYKAAVYFNTNTFPVTHPSLTLNGIDGAKSVEIFDTKLNKLPEIDPRITDLWVGTGIKVSVEAEVPPMGYKVFFYKTSTEKAALETPDTYKIENEFYRLAYKDGVITEIFDKKNNKIAAKSGAGLCLGDDVGSPWGKNQLETIHTLLTYSEAECEIGENYQKLILKGSFENKERLVNKLTYTTTITLYKGENMVRFHNDIDWDGTNSRVFASFPVDINHGDDVYCDVPFGMIKRNKPEIINCLGLTDEWPSLSYAAVSDGDYNVAILKGGLPAARVYEDKLEITLFRGFLSGYKYERTSEIGKHTSDYALTAFTGKFEDSNIVRMGEKFNTRGFTLGFRETEGTETAGEKCLLPALTKLPENLRLSALKLSEEGGDIIVRFYEAIGKEAILTLPENIKLIKLNTLEEPETDTEVSAYTFRKFEIATFKLVIQG